MLNSAFSVLTSTWVILPTALVNCLIAVCEKVAEKKPNCAPIAHNSLIKDIVEPLCDFAPINSSSSSNVKNLHWSNGIFLLLYNLVIEAAIPKSKCECPFKIESGPTTTQLCNLLYLLTKSKTSLRFLFEV